MSVKKHGWFVVWTLCIALMLTFIIVAFKYNQNYDNIERLKNKIAEVEQAKESILNDYSPWQKNQEQIANLEKKAEDLSVKKEEIAETLSKISNDYPNWVSLTSFIKRGYEDPKAYSNSGWVACKKEFEILQTTSLGSIVVHTGLDAILNNASTPMYAHIRQLKGMYKEKVSGVVLYVGSYNYVKDGVRIKIPEFRYITDQAARKKWARLLQGTTLPLDKVNKQIENLEQAAAKIKESYLKSDPIAAKLQKFDAEIQTIQQTLTKIESYYSLFGWLLIATGVLLLIPLGVVLGVEEGKGVLLLGVLGLGVGLSIFFFISTFLVGALILCGICVLIWIGLLIAWVRGTFLSQAEGETEMTTAEADE